MPPQNTPIDLSEHTRRFWKVVIYGPPGVGKSVLASTSQKYRTFVFDCDDGMGSVKAFIQHRKLQNGLVKFWTIKKYTDFVAAWKWLSVHYKEFDLVVIDTVTELHSIIKRGIMLETGHKTAQLQDWGGVLDAIEFASEQFKATSWHVVYLAHEKTVIDVASKTEYYRPSFRGAWKEEYARHVDVIARYMMWWHNSQTTGPDGKPRVEKVLQRWLNAGPDPNISSKDRSGVLARFEKPDIDNLLAKLMSSQGEFSESNDSGMLQPEDPAEVAMTNELQQQLSEIEVE